jgi:curved DNA-binding protein
MRGANGMADNSNSYYKILGVDKKATQADIKKAFRAAALKHHPDKNPGNKEAEATFKLVNEANQVIGNPEKRKKYDEFGEQWQHYEQNGEQGGKQNGKQSARQSRQNRQQRTNASTQYSGSDPRDSFGSAEFSNGGQSDFSDLFEQFFAGRTQGNGNRNDNNQRTQYNAPNAADAKGGDYETELRITLEEAYAGTHRIIQLDNEKLRVTTKPGAYNDQVLRIQHKGAEGASAGHRGDLFVRVNVQDHTQFTRIGDDLHITQSTSVYAAVLGGTVIVQTLSGKVQISIAAGTQYGKTIRLKDKGMPVYAAPERHGALYVLLHVHIPEDLTDEQRALFQQLQATL